MAVTGIIGVSWAWSSYKESQRIPRIVRAFNRGSTGLEVIPGERYAVREEWKKWESYFDRPKEEESVRRLIDGDSNCYHLITGETYTGITKPSSLPPLPSHEVNAYDFQIPSVGKSTVVRKVCRDVGSGVIYWNVVPFYDVSTSLGEAVDFDFSLGHNLFKTILGLNDRGTLCLYLFSLSLPHSLHHSPHSPHFELTTHTNSFFPSYLPRLSSSPLSHLLIPLFPRAEQWTKLPYIVPKHYPRYPRCSGVISEGNRTISGPRHRWSRGAR